MLLVPLFPSAPRQLLVIFSAKELQSCVCAFVLNEIKGKEAYKGSGGT